MLVYFFFKKQKEMRRVHGEREVRKEVKKSQEKELQGREKRREREKERRRRRGEERTRAGWYVEENEKRTGK